MEVSLLSQAVLVLALGVGAQWLGALLRLPSILLLLLAGFLAGPVTGLLRPEQLLPGPDLLPSLVSLSVAFILFEGGLTLRLHEARDVGAVVGRLVTLGALVNGTIAALSAAFLLDLPANLSILLGAILVLSGPTVVSPLLRMLRPRGKVGAILKWEGIVIDPVGALLATLVLQALVSPDTDHSFGIIALGTVRAVVIGGLMGLVAAFLLHQMLRRHLVPDITQAPLTLALAASSFALSNHWQHESGLFAVTVMGFYLANQKSAQIQHITRFKEHLSQLLIASLFVILAARVEPAEVLHLLFPEGLLFLLVLIFIARPASVWVSTLGSGLPWRDRLFLSALFPRGIVAAAVTPLFALKLEESGVEGAEVLTSLTYLVIVGTVAFYGLTSPWVARRLGVSQRSPQGFLFVGAHPLAREIARTLQEAGFDVHLADTNGANVIAARMEGLPATHTNLLSEEAIDELDLGGIGSLLALTPNDEVNSLAAVHGSEVFGRAKVYQPAREDKRGPAGEEFASHLRGRTAFGPEVSNIALARLRQQGAVVKKTGLTEDFDIHAFRERYGDSALLLFRIAGDNLHIVTTQAPDLFAPGNSVIALVQPPAGDEAPPKGT